MMSDLKYQMLERSSKLIQRVSSGIDGLDEMLGGGFPTGHIVVVIGDSGTGKTTLVLQYIMDGTWRRISKKINWRFLSLIFRI